MPRNRFYVIVMMIIPPKGSSVKIKERLPGREALYRSLATEEMTPAADPLNEIPQTQVTAHRAARKAGNNKCDTDAHTDQNVLKEAPRAFLYCFYTVLHVIIFVFFHF
jgi:hypothetical protein